MLRRSSAANAAAAHSAANSVHQTRVRCAQFTSTKKKMAPKKTIDKKAKAKAPVASPKKAASGGVVVKIEACKS